MTLTPIYLHAPGGTAFAFLHPADGAGAPGNGVVICPPFGWAEVASYRPRYHWAQALAAAGHPTMRIDLPGTGDGGGGPADEGRLDAWTAAIGAAVAWLRTDGACQRVTLVGLGLGGLLACRAAGASAVDDLVLWGVPGRGRVAVRELRALHRLEAAEFPVPEAEGASDLPEGFLESGGFVLSAETVEALDALDVATLDLAGVRRALLLGRDGLPVDGHLGAALDRAGVDVTEADGAGWVAMTPADATLACAPEAVVAATNAWLAAASGPSLAHPVPSAPRTSATLALEGGARERPFTIARPWGDCFGIAAEPAGAGSGIVAVLFNAGVVRHTGPNRLWVETSRRWSARGVTCVRIDLAGIGDATGDEGRYEHVDRMYTPELVDEALAVLDELRARYRGARFLLVGLCSGAYIAFHAATRAPDAVGAVMLNPRQFFYDPAIDIRREARMVRRWVASAPNRRRVLRAVRRPRQLMSGVRSTMVSALRARAHRRATARGIARTADGLDRLREAGRRAVFVFSEGEPLLQEMREEGMLDDPGRWPGLRLEIIRGPGHTFRPTWSQTLVNARLDRALDHVAERAPLGDVVPGPSAVSGASRRGPTSG